MELREFYRHRMYGPYNVGPRPDILGRIEPELRVLEDAFATPRELGADRSISGALYDAAGEVVRESVRSGARHRHLAEDLGGAAATVSEPDDAVYLGPLMRHFGHFLLEVLPRLWAFEHNRVRKVYFHPFRSPRDIPDYLRDTLRAVAGPDVQIRVIEAPTRFSKLLVPSPLFRINKQGSPAFQAWAQAFAARVAPEPKGGQFVYVSRRRLDARRKRLTLNEGALEAVFEKRGFEILHPQDLSFFEQIARMRACRLLAGCSGSALHQALFMPRRSAVMGFDSRFTTSQHAIEAMGDHTGLHFACLKELEPGGDVTFDESYLPVIERELDDLLADWPARLETPFKRPPRKYVESGWAS
jgi:hypothetical protein